MGQKDAATEALYEAIQLDPNMLVLMLKTQAQATEIWNYALQRNANDASTYHNLGIALARSKHWQEAIAAVPKYAQAYKNLGLEDIMLIETETLPEPTDELDNKALAVANYNLGIMLLNRAMITGDPESMEEAILSFEESIENEPNNGWTYSQESHEIER